jgi:putative ABC transport system permease protein
MIRNYIVTSYRFIVKSKTYTLLNLAGLVAGLAASFILLIFTINELSYDKFHTKEANIYRVLARDYEGNLFALSPYPLGPALKKEINGIEVAARLAYPAYLTGPVMVRSSGVYVDERSFFCADPDLLRIFDIDLITGNRKECLKGDHSVIISDLAARKYFGTAPPLGRELGIKTAGVAYNLIVTGVFRSLPWNSTLEMDLISGIGVFPAILSNLVDSAEFKRQLEYDPTIETFLLLKPGAGIGGVSAMMPELIRRTFPGPGKTLFSFQRLSDVYLGSANINDVVHKKGSRSTMYIYLALALFVLLLAGINYSILSTARSALRYKEIGVRKVMGATRGALTGQVLSESVLLTFLSFPVSYLLVGLSEPVLQWLFGYRIEVYSASTLVLLPLFAGITLFIGLISGTYIAFYLSSLNPLEALKNKLASHRKINLSRVFTVFQLVITLSLLIAVVTIYRQVRFCVNSEQGIDKRNLLVIPFDPLEFNKYQELKTAIEKIPEVISVSGSSMVFPNTAIATISVKSQTSGKGIKVESINVDAGFFRTMGITMLSGTDFDPSDPMRSRNAFIINQEAAKLLHINILQGATFALQPVIAIVKDFNVHTMYDSINPTIFSYRPGSVRALIVRHSEGSGRVVSVKAESAWRKLSPHLAFDLREFPTEQNLLYKKEKVFGYVVTGFSILAFIVMGMGLFGLALLISERKTKETAIRKVFGATNTNILFGMQKEFLVYILAASVIAIPSTWFFLRGWLDSFFYRISLSWWIFALSVALITIFVSAIILMRTLRVLRENPVKALKYE